MDLASGYGAKNEIRPKKLKFNEMGLNHNAILVIRLPDWGMLRVISRSLFLFTVIVAFLCIRSIMVMNGNSIELISSHESVVGSDMMMDSELMMMGSELLPSIFRDLADEGLVKSGHEALILSSGIGDLNQHSQLLNAIGVDLVLVSDLDRQNSIADESFDLVITSTFHKFIDRVLKIGGIVVMQLSDDPLNVFEEKFKYKIVYIRRFSSTMVAMRKMGSTNDNSVNFPVRRRLCGVIPETKKAALEGLEDVLFEPPQPRGRALAKSSYEKIKFLPNLLGDSLEGYRRRILITDENGENNGVVDWFYENYPKKDQYFEIYNLKVDVYNAEMLEEGILSIDEQAVVGGISDWMRKNVREEDYVVMKAESHVVEEMMREKTICLVDELFLECKNQWEWEDDGEGNKRKRAYWECLALYGRLRDEGVAVHQWWG
ncbi:uncharacterized protein LOC132301439 [Cornus florida]|uniref:uncharacterized protein LOC132301439 n=1 Tax=Cornus florida TaxID=4283 RepID=UPI00289ACC6B|nr:uncharacterized protein LOC132301439 [Cornus florida]